jgi:protein-serine/threonine kinase
MAAASAAERSSSTRRGYSNDERGKEASRAQSADGRYAEGSNAQTNGTDRSKDDAVNAANAAARARRRAQQSPQDGSQQRPSGSREQRSGQSSSANANRGQIDPNGLSREASEVLNRVMISDPKVDLDRERERMAEAVPTSAEAHANQGSSNAMAHEPVQEVPRQGRSRHDHTASSGKREKNTKFGEYYLGNTLGEGEFGKVKMGWKQEGGVQVNSLHPSKALRY